MPASITDIVTCERGVVVELHALAQRVGDPVEHAEQLEPARACAALMTSGTVGFGHGS